MSEARVPVAPKDCQVLLVGLAHSLNIARYTAGCRCLGCKEGARVWWELWDQLNLVERKGLAFVMDEAEIIMPIPHDVEGMYD